MSFLNVLKKIIPITEAVAPTVATAINPAAGAVASLIVSSVVQAEQAGGTGAEKKAAVIASVLPTATGIVSASLQAKGSKTQINSQQMTTAIGSMIDGIVALMNSVQTASATKTAESGATTTGTGTTSTSTSTSTQTTGNQ